MFKKLTPAQMIKLKEQGWQAEGSTGQDRKTEWKQQADAKGFTYKAPNFDPSLHLLCLRYRRNLYCQDAEPSERATPAIAGRSRDAAACSSMRVSVDDLLLFREMVIDRFTHRSQDPE